MHVLMVNNADIEATNDEGWTPLFYAVSKNQYEAAEFLLKNGADCTRVDSMLCSCLHYAVREGFCKIAYLLIKTGGDKLIFQRNNENQLPMHEAVLAGREQVSVKFITNDNVMESILQKLINPFVCEWASRSVAVRLECSTVMRMIDGSI